MKIKVQKRVSLTPRDILLLFELHKNVVLSFPQVMQRAFHGKAKSTAMNRLGRLEGLGVIERWKIPQLSRSMAGPGIFVVFQITKKGIDILRKRMHGADLREKPVRLHGYSIHHDVLLVDVMDELTMKFKDSSITHGKLLERLDQENIIYPDAVLELPNVHERWAIELELTPKSEKRYREIVLRYRLSNAFDRVLYVTGQREIVPKLSRVLDTKFENLSTSPPKEKFLWIDLDALLQKENSPASMNYTKPLGENLHEQTR